MGKFQFTKEDFSDIDAFNETEKNQNIAVGVANRKTKQIRTENQRLRDALEKVDGHALLADHSKKQYVWVCDIRQTCREALAETEEKS